MTLKGSPLLLRYRGASLIRNCPLLGPYSRPMPGPLWWSGGGGRFLMSEVPLYSFGRSACMAAVLEVVIVSLSLSLSLTHAHSRHLGICGVVALNHPLEVVCRQPLARLCSEGFEFRNWG